MAITWTFDLTVEDIDNNIVRIVATRSDDTTNPPATVSVALSADISTQALKLAALDRLWSKYLVKVGHQTAIETVLGNLETAAEANFMAREA